MLQIASFQLYFDKIIFDLTDHYPMRTHLQVEYIVVTFAWEF